MKKHLNKNKVKYNSKQYRDNYLQSDHWKLLRSKVIKDGTICSRCTEKPAIDPHHLRYRNLVDVTPNDLIPLCRACHKIVEAAKKLGMIRREKFKRSRGFAPDDKIIKDRLEYKRSKHSISNELLSAMDSLPSVAKQLICGICKELMPESFLEWDGFKITGKQLSSIKYTFRRFGMFDFIKFLPPVASGVGARVRP